MAQRTTQSAANQCVVMRIGSSATHRSSIAEGSKYPPPRNAHHVSPRAYPATGTRSHVLQRSLAWPVGLSRLLDQSRLVSFRPAASNTSSRLYYSVSHTNHCFFLSCLPLRALFPQAIRRDVPYRISQSSQRSLPVPR